jgi:hypothetical protein
VTHPIKNFKQFSFLLSLDSSNQVGVVEQELEHIPHQSSQYITTILYEICLEIQRAQGQIIGHVCYSLWWL